MNLKTEFLKALQKELDHDSLLGLVHQARSRGLESRDAYQILHQLWLELGFDKAHTESRMQDDLEFVMEKAWYECPPSETQVH